MPELPDLEIYRENLQPLVIGKQIASVSILYPKTMQLISEEDFIRAVSGATLTSIRRLGKRLLFGLDTGEGGMRLDGCASDDVW